MEKAIYVKDVIEKVRNRVVTDDLYGMGGSEWDEHRCPCDG